MIFIWVIVFAATLCAVTMVLLSAPVALVARRALARVRHTNQADQLLPPDWWERFEADLRAYTSWRWRQAREEERRV